MKKPTLIILLFLNILSSQGQGINVEGLITRRYTSCEDINYNMQFLIPEYHKKNLPDTLDALLIYWEQNCGLPEELLRTRILFAIERGDFSEELYDENIIYYLLNFRYNNDGGVNGRINRHTPHVDLLGAFTSTLADRLLQRENISPLEIFFLRMYSKDFNHTFTMLYETEFNGTLMQRVYLEEVKKTEEQVTLQWALMAGAWIPEGNLAVVGTHPFLGLRGGVAYKRNSWDLTLGLKFIKAANEITVYKDNIYWNSDDFFGGYVGVDGAFQALGIRKSRLDILYGIAYDGFDVTVVDRVEPEKDVIKSLGSLNLNAGIGYKFYFNPSNYIAIEGKYNMLNYKNRNGTNLSGDAFTVNLIFGFQGNYFQQKKRKMLDI